MQYNKEEETDMYYYYSIASKYLFVVDISGVFLVQTVLILIPYNWYNFIYVGCIKLYKYFSNSPIYSK